METNTIVGMLMALGMLIGLVIAWVNNSRRQKKGREANMPDFMHNARENSEAICPEVKGFPLALVTSIEGINAIKKDVMKTVGKGIVKGSASGNMRVKDTRVSQKNGMHYVVRYQGEKLYFFPIGEVFSCQNLQMDAEQIVSYTRADIKEIRTNINMIEITDTNGDTFAFQIMIAQQTHHLLLKEEAKALRTFLGELKKKLSA